MTTQETAQKAEKKVAFGKLNQTETNKLLQKYVPKNTPSVGGYIELVNTQILGTDQRGTPRPMEDLIYFLSVAKKLGLDPLAKQIHAVYRWDSRLGREKLIIQTGIDGFRSLAERNGSYAGQDDIVFKVDELFNPVTGDEEKQLSATCTVYKMVKGQRVAIPATARWNEYVQKDSKGNIIGLWKSMPYNQLGKCAEALALRKGFPQDLSGVYIAEELERDTPSTAKALNLPTPESVQKKEELKEKVKADEKKIEEMKKESSKKPEVEEKKQEVATTGDSLQKSLLETHQDLKKGGEKK